MKCDERSPICIRCQSTGRKCDGYKPQRIKVLSVIGSTLDRRLPNPSLTYDANVPEETRALQFYSQRTAIKLADHSHSEFWIRLVPQVSYSDLAVKHMIVTLASIEEALDTAPDPRPCYEKCLKHHSKAIGSITRTPSPPVEVVLIFSVLFATYFNMQGKSSSALDHVENGLNIIREWKASQSPDLGLTKGDAGSEVIENQIGPMFATFAEQVTELHSSSDKDTLNIPKPVSHAQLLPFLMPRRFGSFEEARRYLRAVMSLVTHAMQLYSLFPNQRLDSIRALQARNYLHDWLRSLEGCKKTHFHQPFGDNVSTACILLEIHYRAFSIMLEAYPTRDEMKFDSFNGDFVFIITQSRVLITRLPPDANSSKGDDPENSRNADEILRIGMIPPLFLTATRCRVPHLRRHALSLLRALNSAEGVWNSKSAARVAEQVMLIEERGLKIIRTGTEIGEQRRIRLSSAIFDADTGRLLLKFKRFPYQEQGMLYEEGIVWPARISPFNQAESLDQVSFMRVAFLDSTFAI